MTNNRFDLLDKPMSGLQVGMVFLCFIINFNDGIDVLIVSFSSAEIIKEWGLSKVEMGYIFSAGLTGMMIGCFGLAPLADRYGRRKLFLVSLALITVGTFGIWLCNHYWQILILRLITGLGIGGMLPILAATATEFSNRKYRDFNVGLIQAGWPVGAILTGFLCARIIPAAGWHQAFFYSGCAALLMWVLVFLFMTDSLEYLIKNPHPGSLQAINKLLVKMGLPATDQLPEWQGIKQKTGIKTLFSSLYQFDTITLWTSAFFGFITLYTMMSWIPNIARDAGMPFQLATYVGVTLNLGAALGSASIGAIGAYFGLRQSQVAYLVLGFVVMIFYSFGPTQNAVIFSLVLLIGIFIQGGFNGIWPIVSRVYPAEIRGTGVGYTLGVGRMGAIVGPSLFGYLQDQHISMQYLFILFSIPPLVMALGIWLIRSKQL